MSSFFRLKIRIMKYDDLLNKKKEQEEEEKLKSELYVAKKPNLITRYAAGLLDILCSLILIVGFFFAARYTILDPMGHKEDVDFVHNACAESSLFIEASGGYYELTEDGMYDSSKTPEQNYEARILYYYTNFDYPIGLGMKEEYFKEKNEAKYWTPSSEDLTYSFEKGTSIETIEDWLNTNYTRVSEHSNVQDSYVVGWLSRQYTTAVSTFTKTPDYVKHGKHALLTEYFTLLIAEVLALGIYYILLPLVLKRGCTPFKLVFKMAVADKHGLNMAKKSQILLRYLLIIVINFMIPTLWYFFMPSSVGYLAMIFPLASIMTMGLTQHNTGIHDLAAQTYLADFRDKRLVLNKNDTLLGNEPKDEAKAK